MRKFCYRLTGVVCSFGAMAVVADPVRAEIVLMGNDPAGWVFSTDGFLNAFVTQSGSEAFPFKPGATYRSPAFSIGSASSGSGTHVTSGFVPETFGFNVKSPDLDGNKLVARLSLQTSINNPVSHAWDSDGAATGATPGLIREAWLSYGGSWGDVQAGKSMGIFGSQAILNDMYLYGVGAGLNSKGQPYNAFNTTTGGIGYGYTYAGWNGNIRYTTPAFWGGFKATAGVFEPNEIDDSTGDVRATKTRAPRFEGGLSWAGTIGDATLSSYLNGTWQNATLAGSSPTLVAGQRFTGNGSTVNVYGGELGSKLVLGKMDFVAHGYVGPGLGLSGAQLSFDSIDRTGETHLGYGYYVQAQYHFEQGTSLGVRYGSSYIEQTSYQKKEQANQIYNMTEKDLFGAQVSHQLNKWIRLVGEYDYATNAWSDGATQHEHIGAAGVVVTY